MNHKETLGPYIQAHLQHGTPKDAIKQQLIENGWDAAVIDEAMADIAPEPSIPVPSDLIDKPVLPEVYGLRQAFPEAYRAIKANLSSIAILTAIGMIVPVFAYVGLILASVLMVSNISEQQYLTSAAGGEYFFFSRLLPLFIVAMVLIAIFSVFTQIATSLAVNDAAEKKKSNVKAIALTSLKRTPRQILVGLALTAFIGAPFIILGLIGLAMAAIAPGFSLILFILGPVGVGLSIYLSLRFALLPIVAIFEPRLSIKQLFSRTKRLMSIGGALFYLKLAVVGMVTSIVLSLLSPSTGTSFPFVAVVTDLISIVAFPIFTTAISVVYYRNRLIARG